MKIDKNLDKPIYIQIYESIIDEIINGYLIADEKLPSRRKMCEELGVSPQTVESAYQKLIADGYIISRPGNGYFVSTERVWDEEQQVMKSRIYNFSTNGVETSALPLAEWAKLLKGTVREDSLLFQHGEKAGEWCLRKSIRRLLFRTQNIKCKTEQIIIGPGAEDLLRDIFRLVDNDTPILLNNYFHYRVNDVAVESGKSIEYISSGRNGIDIEELSTHKKGILYQRPTHELPTGVTLSEQKRHDLVKWLGDKRYVIEDSRENDYQYGTKRKTLWEISEGRNVIYLGSFSATIAPSMKIGYIVAPEEFVKQWFEKKRFYANRVSRVEQVTLSKFIDLGHYEKHINYMRNIYREKTETVKKAFQNSELGRKVRISGDDTGMFCLAEFDINQDEKRANKLLADNGIKLSPLSSCIKDETKKVFADNSYTLGYGEMTKSQICDGINRWAELWKEYL